LAACYLCHDQFEQFYNEKDEEWQLRNCVEKDKRLYHPMCYEDMVVSLVFFRRVCGDIYKCLFCIENSRRENSQEE